MARAAVDRSAGWCESFRGRVDGDLLVYLADKYVRHRNPIKLPISNRSIYQHMT